MAERNVAGEYGLIELVAVERHDILTAHLAGYEDQVVLSPHLQL
ncbi:hypothetical protein [Mesorhizobium sp. B3-1-7]|nr:hypothetical protein [Mesorhizobium sp. B3-1-7]